MDRIDNNLVDPLRQESAVRGWRERIRSSFYFILALGIHATFATVLLAHWRNDASPVWSAPAIMVDLAPIAAAPTVPPTHLPPDPSSPQLTAQPETVQKQMTQEKPAEKTEKILGAEKSEEKIDITPEPLERVKTPSDPPTPVEKPQQKEQKKPRPKLASLASAPSPAERRDERAVAPAPGASTHNPNAVPNWKSRLVARLEQYKRYPLEAQSRGDHGVAKLAFSIDRQGGAHRARILHSSGSNLLDAATLSLVQRAAPFPPPPPEMRGTQIAVVVPIRYDAQ